MGMYCCCIRPLEWKELDPKNAECTSSEDKIKITREIENAAHFGRVGWFRLHRFVDELVHCSTNSKNVCYAYVHRFVYSSRCSFRLGRILLYALLFVLGEYLNGCVYQDDQDD